MKRFVFIALAIATVGLFIGAGVAIYGQYNKAMDFDFAPAGYRAITISRRRMIFEVDLKITNKSAIEVIVTDYDFDVFVNGNFAVKIKPPIDPVTQQTKQQKIAGNGDSIVTLRIDFNPDNVFKSVNKYEVITGIILDPSTVKIAFKGTFSISVSGIKVEKVPLNDEYSLEDMEVKPLI